MRISTHALFQRSMENFAFQQSQLNKIQEKISSGKEILIPSDNPIGMMKSLSYHYQINKDDQFVKNAQSAQSNLEYEESILETVNNIYHRYKELTIAAGSGSLSTADRESIIAEMQERLNELVSLANTRTSNGNYLFSGFKLNQIPVQKNVNGEYIYQGDNGQSLIMLGESSRIPVTDEANTLFFNIPSSGHNLQSASGRALVTTSNPGLVNSGTLTTLDSNNLMINNTLVPVGLMDSLSTTDGSASAISFTNAINQVYLETGVRASANPNTLDMGVFTAGIVSGNQLVINGEAITDLLGTESTIIESINAKSGLTGVVASQPGGAGTSIILTASDGRNIQLQTDGTSTAAFAAFDLSGLPLDQVQRSTVTLVSHDAIHINGSTPTNVGLTYGTTLPTTNLGTGTITNLAVYDYPQDPNATYSIVFGAGGLTYSIYNDNNPLVPLEDYDNVPYLPGQSVDFEGIRVTLNGTMNAGDTFGIILEPRTNQSIFSTFENIITKLRNAANDPTQLSYEIGTAISNIDFAEEQLLNIRAQIGARLNIIDSQISYHETLKLISQKGLSQVEDLDYSRAITQLSEYTFTLQAAQQSFVKVQSLNLFYFIR